VPGHPAVDDFGRADLDRAVDAAGRPARLRGQERAENFPVALRVLPRRHREHLRAVYDVVRVIDELGDTAAGDREALLVDFGRDLGLLWEGGIPRSRVARGLAATVRDTGLPREPFDDLIRANLQDQVVHRYATLDDLLGYCALSAAPIGRMVLAVFGVRSPTTERLSDRICAGLQLLEHWQDVGEDRRAGRVYLPQQDLRDFGVAEEDLDAPATSGRLRRLVIVETERAEALLDAGAPLVPMLSGWSRLAVAGYLAGGRAAAQALRRCRGDVLAVPARPRKADVALHAARALRGGRR
jgi:squalene synthase HpnC